MKLNTYFEIAHVRIKLKMNMGTYYIIMYYFN